MTEDSTRAESASSSSAHGASASVARWSARSYLAIDLGASSGRAVLGTLEGSRMRTREVHRFETPLVERGEHLYWDVDSLWGEVKAAIVVASGVAPELASVSVDSWAVDSVPIGRDGTAVRWPYAYRDPRTVGRLPELLRRIPADVLYRRTGIQFLEFNTLPQILVDLQDEPEVVARTATRLLIADYFLYRLSGKAVAERTMASTTQLLDIESGQWAEDLIRAVGDEPARWPRIVAPGTILGPALPECLPSRTERRPLVIASCSHDTAAAVAAVPAGRSGPWAYISSGTWSLVGAELSAPVLTSDAREAGFTNETGLDGTIRFLKNRTGMWVLEECMREWNAAGAPPSYEELFAAAAAATSTERVLDLNASELGQRGGMLAKLDAVCRSARIPMPATRGGLVRLVLESLATSYHETLAQLEVLTGQCAEVVHVVGGGARNHLLNQITADRCDRPVVAGPREATALGNLLVQARALGDLPSGLSIRDAARSSSQLLEYLPDGTAPGREAAAAS